MTSAIAALSLLMMALLTGCEEPRAYVEVTSTETVTLTPESPIVEVGFVASAIGVPYSQFIEVDFEQPAEPLVSVSSDFDFEQRAPDPSLFAFPPDTPTSGSVQFALPKGSQESLSFDVTVTASITGMTEDDDVTIELETSVDSNSSYSSSFRLPAQNASWFQIHVASERAMAGTGLRLTAADGTPFVGTAVAAVDGAVEELVDGPITWPASCLNGPCQEIVELYLFGSEATRIVSSDPEVSLSPVLIDGGSQERAEIRLPDFIYGQGEATTVDIAVELNESDRELQQTFRLEVGEPRGMPQAKSCDCVGSFTVIDRDSGDLLGTVGLWPESLHLKTRSDGTLNLRIEATGKQLEPGTSISPGELMLKVETSRFDGSKANPRLEQQ